MVTGEELSSVSEDFSVILNFSSVKKHRGRDFGKQEFSKISKLRRKLYH